MLHRKLNKHCLSSLVCKSLSTCMLIAEWVSKKAREICNSKSLPNDFLCWNRKINCSLHSVKIKYSYKFSCNITKHGKSRQNHDIWQESWYSWVMCCMLMCLYSLVCISVVTSVYRCPFICTICFCLHSFIHSFIHSFVQSDSQSVSQSVICSEWQVQIRQCVTQCQPDSKAQKRTLTAPFRLTTVTFKKI